MIIKIIKRTSMLLIVLLGVSLLSFALSSISTVDPAELIARRVIFNPTPEQIEAMRIQLGLDKPIYLQYFDWLGGVFKGDFGTSFLTRKPVGEELFSRIPITLKLAGLALLISALISIPIAAACAMRKNGVFDHTTRAVTIVGLSMPSFLLGFLLLLVFAVYFPVFRVVETGNGIKALILPAISLGLPFASSYIRIFRTTLLSEMNKDYVRYARARGLSKRRIMWRHVMRNAMPSMLTMLCQSFGFMIAGCAVIEKLFSMNGLGGFLADAIINRDLPVINGSVFLIALIFVLLNTLSDVINARITPRMIGGATNA